MPAAPRRLLPAILVLGAGLASGGTRGADLPEEKPLWADLSGSPVDYPQGEQLIRQEAEPWTPTGQFRIFRRVAVPTYSIHPALPGTSRGAGVVICPGGGYRELRIDWEGHDVAIWLARRGVASLVLKYRTNELRPGGTSYRDRICAWDDYLPAVVSDARQAVRILRGRSESLGIDPRSIGVIGFSAGGHLAFSAAFDARYWTGDLRERGQPDFAGMFYPWIWDDFPEAVRESPFATPVFMLNGREDPGTPAALCLDLYPRLLERGAPVQLHVYAKGGHGFALGDGEGRSAARWKEDFLAWLEDQGFAAPGAGPDPPRPRDTEAPQAD